MEIQQMRFDGKRVIAERRTDPNIRHRIKALVADSRARDIHTVGGDGFVVPRKIDGRHRVLVPISAPASWRRLYRELISQQRARMTDFAFVEQLADVATR